MSVFRGAPHKTLVDTYTGDSTNSRELDLGDDYDEVHICLLRSIGATTGHLAEAYSIGAAFGVFYVSGGNEVDHEAGSLGGDRYQGKMTGADANKIKLGASGGSAYGTNKSGWTYRIVARKAASVETLP